MGIVPTTRTQYHMNTSKITELMIQGDEDNHKTTFRTRYGHYKFALVPFRFINAPNTFMCLINNVLRSYLDTFLLLFVDDILVIYSKT